MTETIEVADELVDTASISDGRAVVSFSRTEAALADLRARFKDAKFDLTTTKGDTAARQARRELVSLRTGLDRKRKELKAPAVEFNRKIDSEAARLTSEIEALEDPIDAQIRIDEARREEERQAKLRAEEERVAGHRERIADITAVALRAVGLSSADIHAKIVLVTKVIIDDGFEEFAAAAINAKAETLLKLEELRAAAVHAEEAAAEADRNRIRLAELEAENAARQAREAAERAERESADALARRQEQERLALERRAEQARLAQSATANELVDELRRIQRRGLTSSAAGMLELVTLIEAIEIGVELGDFAGVAQKAKDDALADMHELHVVRVTAEAEQANFRQQQEELRRQQEAINAQRAAMAPPPVAQPEPAATQVAETATEAQAADLAPCRGGTSQETLIEPLPAAPELATVNLGTIGKRLGFALPQSFIEGALGVVHTGQDKWAILWRQSQWVLIKAALRKHIDGLE